MISIRLLYFVLLLSSSSFTFTRVTTPTVSVPKFSSMYTTLNLKTCRAQGRVLDESSMYLCQGYGGYRVRINNISCCAAKVSIIPPRRAKAQTDESEDIRFEMLQKSGFEHSGRRIEWRLADGKPFAVILRLDEVEGTYTIVNQWLTVKGLIGYEEIDSKVDVKMANSNLEAQKLADGKYSKLVSTKK